MTLIAATGCEGPSTMVINPTYAVLSRNQFCRALRAHGRGGSQKVTSDGKGEEGGSRYPSKMIYEQPSTEKFIRFGRLRLPTFQCELNAPSLVNLMISIGIGITFT